MGTGAVLVPGGNDAMLLVGVPLLLPNLLAAYVAMSGMMCTRNQTLPVLGGASIRS